MKLKSQTLWSDKARTRFFKCSDGQNFPEGSFEIWTLTGRHKAVDEASLLPFEVTKEEAKLWAKEQFGLMLDATRSKIESWIERLRNYSPPPTKPVP